MIRPARDVRRGDVIAWHDGRVVVVSNVDRSGDAVLLSARTPRGASVRAWALPADADVVVIARGFRPRPETV